MEHRELLPPPQHENEDPQSENEGVSTSAPSITPRSSGIMGSCFETYRKRIRGVGTKGAILVLFLNTLVDLSYYGAIGHILQALLRNSFHVHPTGMIAFIDIIVAAVPLFLYPVAGWLADVHLGRYKTIRISMWLIWTGFAALLVVFSIHYTHNETWTKVLTYYITFPIAFITINVGIAGYQANIIPFGLDQMPTSSGVEFSAFVHWYYWSRNIGASFIVTILLCTTSSEPIIIAQCVVEVVCLTVALLCCYLLKKWMVIEPHSHNPFRTVYEVLKFAGKHKSPLQRSSLTYWEDELPSRIDLAKTKYGGPLSVENVEDVKTLLRISLVLAAIGGFFIAYYTNGSLFVQHLSDPILSETCSLGDLLLSELDSLPILISIPFYEFLLYPLFQKYIPTTLRRIGAGMVVVILSLASVIALDTYGHAHERNSTECFLINATARDIDVSSGFITVPYTLSAVAEMLVYISTLEFLCAQAPYNMRGMLIGIYYSMRGIFALFAGVVVLAFTLGFEQNPYQTSPSCGTLYYLFTMLVAIVGLIVYVFVSKAYKRRQRDDTDTLINQQAFVVNYYGAL